MTALTATTIWRALAAAFANEKTRVSLWLPVPIAAGIVAYFALPTEPSLALSVGASGAVVLVAWLMRRRAWYAALVLFVLALGGLGFSAARVGTILDDNTMLNRDFGPTGIEGRVARTEIMPDGVRLTLTYPRIDRVPPAAKPESIRVKVKDMDFAKAPKAGADIGFFGQIMAISEPVLPGAFDFRRHAYFRHQGGTGWSYGAIKILDPDPPVIARGEEIDLTLERARKTLAAHVFAQLNGDVAAMTAARMNGEQTAISESAAEALRAAGLSHLMAASGENVTVMGLLIYFPLRALLALIPFVALRYPIKKWAACAAILSSTAYTLMVGSPPAAGRALLMSTLIMLAVLFDRRTTPLRLLSMSTALYLLLTPYALMGPSFQLSFSAVLVLVAFGDFARARNDDADERPRWLLALISGARHLVHVAGTSLLATAATLPICLYHFQSFSLYGFIANMLAVPLTGFWTMPATLAAYVALPFGLDAPFIRAAGMGDAFTLAVAQMVAAWPHALFFWPAMPAACLIATSLGGLWSCLWRGRKRYLGLLPVCIALAYPLYIAQPDFMITADGKTWAARLTDGTLAVRDLDKNDFVARQWQQRLGMPPLRDAAEVATAGAAELRCDDAGCIFRRGAHSLALPHADTPQAALEDCAQADIVVANVSIKDCAAPYVIDEASLWFHGAHSVSFAGDKVTIQSARATRGGRPWSMGYRKPIEKEEY